MKCKRCGNELTGRQQKWCSPRCSKLGLKALYKRRNREKINTYNQKYRRLNKGGWKYTYKFSKTKCYFCGTKKNLHAHHLDYEKNIVVMLCDKCHSKLHKLLRYTNDN